MTNLHIPKSWTCSTLGAIAKWGSGGTPSRGNLSYYGGSIPWFKTGELGPREIFKSEETITPDALIASNAKLFPKGSIALAMYGATIGKVSFLGIDATTNQACAVGIPNSKVTDSTYLYHYLRSQKEAFLAAGQGGAQPNISQTVVKNWPIPIPSIEEQQRIANKLDTILTRLDAVNERMVRIALILKRFRQSVLAAAVSGRLTADWRGDTEIKWESISADKACLKVQSGGTPKAGFSTNGIPFLKVYNIVDQQIAFDYKPQYVKHAINDSELKKSQVQPGDVLMNIVGPPLGKVAIVTDQHAQWNINQAITLFRPSEKLTTEWIYILLCEGAPIRDVLAHTKGSVGQINISLSQCRAFEFVIPPRIEQDEIVRRTEALFAFADRLEARLGKAQTATERLTPSLLAKAFRGKLVRKIRTTSQRVSC